MGINTQPSGFSTVSREVLGPSPSIPVLTQPWDRTQIVIKTIGDSRFGGYFGAATGANSTATIAVGDLQNVNAGAQNVAKYLGGGAIRVQNFAVSGTRTRDLAGQLDIALASGTPSTEVVAILSSTNDRSSAPLIAIDAQLTFVRAAVARIRSTGRRVLLCLEPPQRGSYWGAGVPEQQAQMVALHRELASLDTGVRIADFLSPVIDATGSVYASGTRLDPYYDVVHPKLTAGILWGRAIIAGLGDWIAANRVQSGLAASVTNLVTNSAFTGTGGTGINSGNAPDSWVGARTAGNSWDKSYVWGATCAARASSTAYTENNRITISTNGAKAAARADSTVYAQFARVSVAANPDLEFVATTGGTSAGSPPTFSTTVGGTTSDGTVTWTTVPANAPTATARANTTDYVLNDRVALSEHPSVEFVVLTPGTTAASKPRFSGVPGTFTTDGTVTWVAVAKRSVAAIEVDYQCIVAGTSATTQPVFNTELFSTTYDGTAVWLAVPRFNAFDGQTGVIIYGNGTADNTRCTFHQDISMASAGLSVGDVIRGSMFHAALGQWNGFQLEVQAMTGTTKISSSFDMSYGYTNSAALESTFFGKLETPEFTIPANADTIRLRFHGFSRSGYSVAHILTKPVLEEVV